MCAVWRGTASRTDDAQAADAGQGAERMVRVGATHCVAATVQEPRMIEAVFEILGEVLLQIVLEVLAELGLHAVSEPFR